MQRIAWKTGDITPQLIKWMRYSYELINED